MWLPWIVYGLLRSITASRHRSRWALFSGLATGLSVAGAWQFIFMSAGLVSLFLLGALRAWSDRVKAMLRDYRFVGIFALSTLAVVLPLALLMLPARRLAVDAPWSFTGADMTSVHLERVLSPSWQNPLWRNFSRAWWPLENGQDGVVGFSLAGAALVLFTLSRRRLTKAAPWVCLALGGTALMLGLTLHLGGKTVLIPVPDRLAGRIAGLWPVLVGESYPAGWAGRVPVLLPSGFLFILFSPYRNFHHYGRWALVSALGLAVLTAKAFSAGVRGQLAWKRAGVGLLLLSAVLLEYNLQPPANVTSVADMRRQVDDWLAVQPELGVLLEVPLSYTFGGHTLYNALFHNQKIVHGYSSIPPRAFQEMRPILDQWPSDETIDLLTRLGVDYVLVNVFAGNEATFEGAELPAILSRPQLRLVGRFPDAVGPVRAIYPFQLAR